MQLFKDILLTVAVVLGGILMIRLGTMGSNASGSFGDSSDTGSFDTSSSDSGCDSGDGGSCD